MRAQRSDMIAFAGGEIVVGGGVGRLEELSAMMPEPSSSPSTGISLKEPRFSVKWCGIVTTCSARSGEDIMNWADDTLRQCLRVSSVRGKYICHSSFKSLLTSKIGIDESSHGTQFRQCKDSDDHLWRIRHE